MLFFYWDFGLVFYFNLTFKHLLWYQKNILILSWYLIWWLWSHLWRLLLKNIWCLSVLPWFVSENTIELHIVFIFLSFIFFYLGYQIFFSTLSFYILLVDHWTWWFVFFCFFFVFSWSQKITDIELALNFAK